MIWRAGFSGDRVRQSVCPRLLSCLWLDSHPCASLLAQSVPVMPFSAPYPVRLFCHVQACLPCGFWFLQSHSLFFLATCLLGHLYSLFSIFLSLPSPWFIFSVWLCPAPASPLPSPVSLAHWFPVLLFTPQQSVLVTTTGLPVLPCHSQFLPYPPHRPLGPSLSYWILILPLYPFSFPCLWSGSCPLSIWSSQWLDSAWPLLI